jgi:TetR/AcrR family transcriptional repressor of nem operon
MGGRAEDADRGRPRDLSKQETREALLRAAREAFASEGFDGPSLDAICSRAGFTRGAFYVHFASRDDLVAAVVERSLGEFIEGVIAAGDPEHDLATTVDRYSEVARFLSDGRGQRDVPSADSAMGFHQVLEACRRSESLGARLVSILQEAGRRVARAASEGQRAGRVREDLSADQIGTLLMLLALGVATALDAELPFDLAGARQGVLDLLLKPHD